MQGDALQAATRPASAPVGVSRLDTHECLCGETRPLVVRFGKTSWRGTQPTLQGIRRNPSWTQTRRAQERSVLLLSSTPTHLRLERAWGPPEGLVHGLRAAFLSSFQLMPTLGVRRGWAGPSLWVGQGCSIRSPSGDHRPLGLQFLPTPRH